MDEGFTTTASTQSGIDGIRWRLGGSLAVLFPTKGYDVVLMGRRREVLVEVRDMVEEEVRRSRGATQSDTHTDTDLRVVFVVKCDVTDEGAVRHRTCSFNVAPPCPPDFRFEVWGDVPDRSRETWLSGRTRRSTVWCGSPGRSTRV